MKLSHGEGEGEGVDSKGKGKILRKCDGEPIDFKYIILRGRMTLAVPPRLQGSGPTSLGTGNEFVSSSG